MRFLLLTDPRSGTMMLTDTLTAAHPEIRWYNLYASNPDDPLRHFLNWEEHLRGEGVSGTTMHRVGDEWIRSLSPINPKHHWRWLNERHDRTILLRRENVLRRYLSKQVGVLLRTYRVDEPRQTDPGPSRIVIQEFLEFLEATETLHRSIDVQFPGALALTYGQLAEDWADTFGQMQDYLGIPSTILPPVTYRQETRPLVEAIENYTEIRDYLSHRGYERWFDE